MTFIDTGKINEGISAIGGQSISYAVESGITYAYHTFTRVGTHEFKVLSGAAYAKVLVVAGGGGGGMDMGGGGGGGGVLYTSYYLTASDTPITVTVGRGGWGGPAGSLNTDAQYRQDGAGPQPSFHQFTVGATNGENSSFGTCIATGGGYGGSSYFGYTPNNGYGNTGGSGGGASGYSDGNTGRGATGIPGQGNSGGGSSGQYYSGGGGGAGGAGASGSNQPNGGAGILYSDMSSFYFGGGGGGASYSLGTGGNGGIGGGGGGAVGVTTGGSGINPGQPGSGGSPGAQTNTRGGDGGENTGGGGGGGSHYNRTNRGGNGGSGIVIIKYPLTAPITTRTRNVVQSGLSLYLDASDTNSYPGSGNTWYDLSNNGKNFIWNTTPSFTSGSVPYFSTSGRGLSGAPSNSFGINNSSGYTIFMSFYQNTLTNSGAFKWSSSNGSGTAGRGIFLHGTWSDGNFYFDQAGCCGADTRTNVAMTGSTGAWSIVALTCSADRTVRTIWQNGQKKATNTTTALSINLNSTPANIATSDEYGTTWDARIGQFLMYNRALTDAEMYQNWEELRTRVGI